MTVGKVIELIGESRMGWEDAVKDALKNAAKTVENINGIEVLNLTAHVEAGEIIATNGATGTATGAHIHYELRYADGGTIGRTVWGDPEEFELEVGEMQEEAISYHGVSDLRAAHILHIITEAPIYFEFTIRGKKIAKKLYVVGGSKRKLTGEEAEEFVDYSGKDGTETLDNVLKKRK